MKNITDIVKEVEELVAEVNLEPSQYLREKLFRSHTIEFSSKLVEWSMKDMRQLDMYLFNLQRHDLRNFVGQAYLYNMFNNED